MQLHHLGHAALLVDTVWTRVLIDPGTLSDAWHDLEDLSVIAVTHGHVDHLDLDRIGALVAANPKARVLADPSSTRVLLDAGIEATGMQDGEVVRVDDLTITGTGTHHAQIHPSIPRIDNVGYLVAQDGGPRILHPGDALDHAPGVDVLALPLAAPWATVGHIADFARRVGASSVVPIHDAVLSDTGRDIHLRLVRSIADAAIADLSDGSRLTL